MHGPDQSIPGSFPVFPCFGKQVPENTSPVPPSMLRGVPSCTMKDPIRAEERPWSSVSIVRSAQATTAVRPKVCARTAAWEVTPPDAVMIPLIAGMSETSSVFAVLRMRMTGMPVLPARLVIWSDLSAKEATPLSAPPFAPIPRPTTRDSILQISSKVPASSSSSTILRV